MFNKLSNIINKASEVANKISNAVDKVSISLGEEKVFSNGVYKGDLKKQESYPYEMVRHGIGEMKYSDGRIYVGKWEENIRINGKFIWQSGQIYEGIWQNDNVTGKGKMIYPSGFYYIGFFVDCKKDGHGIMYNKQGEIVAEGNWKQNEFTSTVIERTITFDEGSYTGFLKADIYLPHGRGVLSYSNGSSYYGNWNEGKKSGKGIMIYANKDTYDGEWKDNQRNGKGALLKASGDILEGNWLHDEFISLTKEVTIDYDGGTYNGLIFNNVPNGKGKMTYNNGNYFGEWKDGKKNGIGQYTWKEGDVYEGEWKDNKRSGKGKYIWKNGGVYEGDFLDGKLDGKGVRVFSDGIIYDGEWKDSKKSGQGILKDASGVIIDQGVWEEDKCVRPIGEKTIEYDGGTYTGMIVNEEPEGKGLIIFEDGRKYDGDWIEGYLRYARLTYLNGDVYEGEFDTENKECIRDFSEDRTLIFPEIYIFKGNGNYYWANGDIYEGEWLESGRSGLGIFKYSDGQIYEGEFKNNKKYGKGILSDKEGKILEANFWLNDICINTVAKRYIAENNFTAATNEYEILLHDVEFDKYKPEVTAEIELIRQLELKSLISKGFGNNSNLNPVKDNHQTIGDDFDDFA